MRRLILISILILSISVSCDKMLEPKVYSILTDENAFQTKDDAVAAVNAVYARLKQPSGNNDSWMYYAGFQVMVTDMTTDVANSTGSGDFALMANCAWGPANAYLGFAWTQQFKVVSDANNGLYYIPKMTSLTDAQKAQFLGELKFLRSLGYFDLTNAFGAVPLMSEESVAQNIANPDYEAKVPVTEVTKINEFIIKDLEYAIANLPADYVSNSIYATNDVGRATKGAAMTLLCKLYMREKNWAKVQDLTTQIMALKKYDLYPTYAGLFAENNKWCSENIFSALANNLVDAVEIINHFGPINNPQVTDRWGILAVPWYFWNTFEKNDARREMFYYDYIGTDGRHYVQPPAGQTNPPAGFYYMPNVCSTKFADPNGSKTYYDGHVFPIFRYADVILSRAEALNELNGPTQESVDLINQIKGRSKATLLGAASTFTKETLRDAILKERGWEFFLECKRREDLIRMDKYETIQNAYLAATGKTTRVNIAKNKYFPYPQTQVDLNNNLVNTNR